VSQLLPRRPLAMLKSGLLGFLGVGAPWAGAGRPKSAGV